MIQTNIWKPDKKKYLPKEINECSMQAQSYFNKTPWNYFSVATTETAVICSMCKNESALI